MADFVEKVLFQKRKKIEKKKGFLSFSALFQRVNKLSSPSLFSNSILSGKSIIAEIKKASPSKGVLFSGDMIEKLGRTYEAYGASAVSLVTEEKYFHGRLEDLEKLKAHIRIPVLRKDFIIDEYQILESKQSRADAVLLIASLLTAKKLKKFLNLINDFGMEALVEVHSRDELEKAFDVDAQIIGINNRDLKTFNVDLNTAKSLLPLIPDSKIKIVESGFKNDTDLLSYKKFNVNAFLIGEALVTASHPGGKLKKFCSILREE